MLAFKAIDRPDNGENVGRQVLAPLGSNPPALKVESRARSCILQKPGSRSRDLESPDLSLTATTQTMTKPARQAFQFD